ncbi:MAG: flagellar hook-basal body complex protein FliE [Proteobacteria bacterium]|nr:flagellar hook-basal body complex protein FliE [Pseudomonadota bacterium]
MKLPPDSLSSLQGKSLLPDPSRPSVAESGANIIGQTFERMLMEVNRQHQEAEQKQVELLTASEKDIHGTVIAMEKAEISLRLLLQVRNKLTTAYEEVMRMQV